MDNVKNNSGKINKYVGKKLMKIRKLHKETQQELADRLDISKNSIINYENGHTPIPIDTLIKIAEIYQVSLNFFNLNDEKVNKYKNLVKISAGKQDILISTNKSFSVDICDQSDIELVGKVVKTIKIT